MTTILAIDDEPKNLKLIQLYLMDTGYEILTATSGVEGWELLTQCDTGVDVILLDRMMPIMNGIQFMEKIKQEPAWTHIPVIMQTAAAEANQVAEGVRAGVFYYLTKPYDEEILLTLVQAALQHGSEQNTLREEARKYKKMLGLVENSHFVFRTLDEARDLTVFLANFFPEPERIVLGLSELLVNAVEHGNLGISYHAKTELNDQGRWEEEVRRRLALPEYASKQVHVRYEKDAQEIRLTIQDDGDGFDWRQYLEINPTRATDNHGRGIAMARLLSFDTITYRGNGNEVSCTVRYA